MMDKERFLKSGLLEQYVLGLADEEEAREVELFAQAYPEIQEEIDSLRRAVDDYAGQFVQLPAAELKARAGGSDFQGGGKSQPVAAQAAPSRWMAAAAIALLAVLSFLALSLYNGKVVSDQHYQVLNAEFEELKKECAQREQARQIYALISDPGTRPVALKGAGPTPGAHAVVYWNPGRQLAYINAAGLPLPPPGKAYQIWADVEGKMVSMGMADCRRREIQALRFVENAESFNVTLEPEGGSEEPTVALLCASGKA